LALPHGLTSPTLESSADGVRFRNPAAGASIEVFDLTAGSGTWIRRSLPRQSRRVALGSIEWRADGSRDTRFEPFAVADGRSVPTWWDGDRFAWDRVDSVASLSPDVAVLATAAGPIVVRVSTTPRLQWLAWTPAASPRRVAEARRDGKWIGVGIMLADGREYLAEATSDRARLIPSSGQSLFESAVVHIGPSDDGATEPIHIKESWHRFVPAPIESLFPADTLPRLFARGQFAFDGFTAGAPVGAASWWVAPPCESTDCLITRNELTGNRYILRDVERAPCAFSALRGREDNTLVGVCRNRTAWQRGSNRWTRVSLNDVRPAFRTGDRVAFRAERVDWTLEGAQDAWATEAFTLRGANRSFLVQTDKGTALAFDMFTSVALDRSGHLAIGTRGGLWWWPVDRHPLDLLTAGAAPALRQLDAGTPETTDIARIRIDPQGGLWARLTSGAIVTIDRGVVHRTTDTGWPVELKRAGPYVIGLDESGVSSPSGSITRTKDAWGLGRQPLLRIVDFQVIGDAVWVATQSNGVVRLHTAPQGGLPRQ
jgi:hypothetical protein